MKNHFFVTILVVSSICNIGHCENIDSDEGKNFKNLNNDAKYRHTRGYQVVSENNIGGMPINEFTGNDRLGDYGQYNYNKNGYSNTGMRLFEKNGHRYNFDDGNPDVHGDIQRPCQVYDTFCIRKFFSEHSKCKISGRRVPNPLYRSTVTVNFGLLNITENLQPAEYTNLNNARISEFYINKVTDNLVIAVTFENILKTSNDSHFKYYLRGREPVVTTDTGAIQYGVLTVTVIIPHIHDLRLERSEIYTYGDNNIFGFYLGPQIGLSTDPEVDIMYAKLYPNIAVAYQEYISNEGNFFVTNFIQYNICDFGLHMI